MNIFDKLNASVTPEQARQLRQLVHSLILDAELKYGLGAVSKHLLRESGYYAGYKLDGPAGQTSPIFKTENECWKYMFGREPTAEEIEQHKCLGFKVVPQC